ncbi:hypothetical protein DSO57_1033174 [Entomophthora muscae]|uniref:Uncharacterized protein n=1 Tax=Entomophthora muscae TaxID=34485 RepID=A0ACC2UK38_9FUNG|nr:hypothetical protein DSO57_1033174 [Entomophthora muscae]
MFKKAFLTGFVTCNLITWSLEARLRSQLKLPNPTTQTDDDPLQWIPFLVLDSLPGSSHPLLSSNRVNNNHVHLLNIFSLVTLLKQHSYNTKLTWKPIKVITTKKVRNKEVELTSYVFDVVHRQELVPSTMLEKVKPVLTTSYEPYVSDGNQEEDKEPEFFITDEGKLVLKKVAAFYTKVPMPCVVL